MTRQCFKCGTDIEQGYGRIQAVDIPYVNLWFCRGCFKGISDMNAYLNENYTKVVELSLKNKRKDGR